MGTITRLGDTPDTPGAIEGVDLETFEALVNGRRHDEALKALWVALRLLRKEREFAGQAADDSTRTRLYSRLAAAIGALFCDPQLALAEQGFELLALEHATLSNVFRASVFGNTDHLLRQFGAPDPGGTGRLIFASRESVDKLFLLYSLDSGLELGLEEAMRSDRRRALPAFLGMLASPIVLSPDHHSRRERLLKLGPMFEEIPLGDPMLEALVNSYMCSSYAESATKHEIKRSFNRMLRQFVESRVELPSFPQERQLKGRPTMLVPVETFASRHVMYRCFAPAIRRLRERFKLVVIGSAASLDEASKQLFDEVVVLDESSVQLDDIGAAVRAVGPDVIYYPSVGMSTTWWVTLSTVRLAPIQLMSIGHPATTHSQAMDYILVAEGVPGDPSTLGEIALVVFGTLEMVHRGDADFPAPAIREAPDVLRIAVPSMVAKLSPAFMQVCQNLVRSSSRKLEFHFFPNLIGLSHWATVAEIGRWLPEAFVYKREDYNVYLRNLARCDLHLSTFPFGGFLSNIDTMKLCIPMVAIEGPELHSQTDSGSMRAVGMPEWLIAHDWSEFERAALRLIESDAERLAIAHRLRDVDVDMIFSSREGNEYASDFANAVWFAYLNHEAILRSGRRYWRVEERREFQGDHALAGNGSRKLL